MPGPATCSGANRAWHLSARALQVTRRLKTARDLLAQHILHSDDSTMKLSVSVALGIFSGILPIWGFQTIAAIALAFCLRLNKVILIAASNISQPPLTPAIVYGSIVLGKAFSAQDAPAAALQQYVVGSILLALLSALLSGALTYLLVHRRRQRRMAS